MGLIENIGASRSETRAIGGVPWQPWLDPRMRFDVGGPTHPNRQMNYGLDTALGLPALYSGAKILSDSAASLPIHLYQQNRQGRRIKFNGPSIFDKPSVLGTRFDWIFTAMSSLVLQGNAWGLISGRDGYGYPTGVEWIPTDQVEIMEDQDQPFNPLRTKVYAMGREMKWFGPNKELFHVKGFATAGRVEGFSPLRMFALTIASGMSAAEYGRTWFDSGGFPPGTFQNSEMEVDPDDAAKIRAMLVSSLRRREPLVFGRDWDYTPVTVPPSEAQFIDAMQLNATQIAAILNLPPNRLGGKSGDSLTYATVSDNALQVIEALTPWLCRLEQAFSDELLPRNRVTEFNTDALLRTDLQTRMNIYQIQRNIGMLSIDELRELENREPLPDGQGNETIPLLAMVAMMQRAGAVPKTMVPQVQFLMDTAAAKMEAFQQSNPDPGTYTAQSSGWTVTEAPPPPPPPPAPVVAPIAATQPPKPGQPALPAAQDPTAQAAAAGRDYANMLDEFSRTMESSGHYGEAADLRDISNKLKAVTAPTEFSGAMTASKQVEDMLDIAVKEARSHEDKEWHVD